MADGDDMRQHGSSELDLSNKYQVKVSLPGEDTPESYFQCRYDVLRQPLGFPIGSERLIDDGEAIHAWVEKEGLVLSVGRAHETGRNLVCRLLLEKKKKKKNNNNKKKKKKKKKDTELEIRSVRYDR